MSASIRLSRRTAINILAMAANFAAVHGKDSTAQTRALAELERALAPRPRSSAVRKTEWKRRSKSAELKVIRVEVEKRAGGKCENCGARFSPASPAELDHQFGRVRAKQSVRNCWMLCRPCHRARTNNSPSATWWWARISTWAHALNYRATMEAACVLAEKHEARGIR